MSATAWTEARANVASAGLPVLLIRLVAFAAAAGLSWVSITAADHAIDAAARLDDDGRQLLIVNARSASDPVDAGYCARLAGLEGVRTSGGTLVEGNVRLASGQDVPLVRVTSGLSKVVAPTLRRPSPVLLGGTLAGEVGIPSAGARVGVVGDDDVVDVATAVPLPVTGRSESFDDGLLVVDASLEQVDTCYVEPSPRERDAVIAAIGSLAPPDRPVVVVPFRDDLERDRSPERDLARAAGGPLSAVIAVVLGLVPAAWWYARRQELVLYRTFGLAIGQLRLLLAYEWLATVGVAVVAGTAWATWATGSQDPARLAVTTGLLDAGAALAASAAVVGVVAKAAARLAVDRSLKGG